MKKLENVRNYWSNFGDIDKTNFFWEISLFRVSLSLIFIFVLFQSLSVSASDSLGNGLQWGHGTVKAKALAQGQVGGP